MPEKPVTPTPTKPRTSLGNLFNPRTIRARLIRLLSILVLVPLIAFVVASVVIGLRISQQQAIAQFDTIASQKLAKVEKWLLDMRSNMVLELVDQPLGERLKILLDTTPDSPEYQEAYSAESNRLKETIKLNTKFEEFFILDTKGQVILSTDPTQEKKNLGNQQYFLEGLKSYYVNPPRYSDAPRHPTVVFSRPIVYEGQNIGVFAARANLQYLGEIMSERGGLGRTGETYLVDSNFVSLTNLLKGEQVRTEATKQTIEFKTNGSGLYTGCYGDGVVGVYKWVPDLQLALVTEQAQSEAFAATYTMLAVNLGVTLLSLALAVLMAFFLARDIGDPITHLANAAQRIAAGDLTVKASIERSDEVGFLATTFNSMTAQLRQTLESLEQRVADRTIELEKKTIDLENVSGRMKKRADQLQAVAKVGRAVTSVQNLDELLPNITQITSEQLGFYHIGIFLLDKEKEYAVLSAANSEGGKRMLERGHKLKVGAVGIVGYVASTDKPRIALDTGADAIFFTNPDLPDTHSEMAIPLHAGSEIIGVLDVQSEQPAAFGQEDIELLTILADQVSIAIQNARRFQETQEAIRESEITIRQYLRKEWKGIVEDVQNPGYRFSIKGVNPLEAAIVTPNVLQATQSGQTSMAQEKSERRMAVPIKLRGQVIGVMHLQSASQRAWEKDIVDITQAIADRVALAVENARLLESSQNQAAKERTIGEISTKISAATSMDNIIKIAVGELGNIIPDTDILIRFVSGEELE